MAAHGCRYGRAGLALSADAAALLRAHAWPGNVRELRNAMEQATLAATTGEVTVQDLGLVFRAASAPRPAAAPQTLPDMVRESLAAALERSAGNVSHAARALGISRDTMRYRMAKHGLDGATG